MDEKGVYAVARSFWDSGTFMNQRFTQREAWLWLIGAAVWRRTSLNLDGRRVMLERGEFCFAVRFLADKWKWSKSAVSRFLVLLENRDMIRDTSRDARAVFIINKYDEFQVVGLPKRDTDRDTDRDARGTVAGQSRDKEETLKHIETLEVVEAPAKAVASKPLVRATRWPSDREVPESWFAPVLERFRELERPPPDLHLEAAKFAAYWAAKSGKDATKLDWPKTFLNWCLNARTDQRTRPTSHETFAAAGFFASDDAA